MVQSQAQAHLIVWIKTFCFWDWRFVGLVGGDGSTFRPDSGEADEDD